MDLPAPPPEDDPDPEAMWRYADVLLDVHRAILLALRAIIKDGEAPDLEALEKGPQVLEVLRSGRISDGRVELTEDDLATARRLVDLVRTGAPKEEITTAALRVHKIMNRPQNPAFKRSREECERFFLEALHNRGVEPTEDELRDVRRLAALAAEDAEDMVEVQLESDEICRRLFPPQTGA